MEFRVGGTGLGLGVGCGIGLGVGAPIRLAGVPLLGDAVAGVAAGLAAVDASLGRPGARAAAALRGLGKGRAGAVALAAGGGCGVGLGYGFGAGIFLTPRSMHSFEAAVAGVRRRLSGLMPIIAGEAPSAEPADGGVSAELAAVAARLAAVEAREAELRAAFCQGPGKRADACRRRD